MRQLIRWFTAALVILFLVVGCTTIRRSPQLALRSTNRVVVYPFVNNTPTPEANKRAVSMVTHLLEARGLRVLVYPLKCNSSTICQDSPVLRQQMRTWARRRGIHYALTGSVNEWRYKVGLDGEPAVSVSLSIVHVDTSHVVWSAVGSKIGGSRSSLGNVALNLLSKMLSNVRWR